MHGTVHGVKQAQIQPYFNISISPFSQRNNSFLLRAEYPTEVSSLASVVVNCTFSLGGRRTLAEVAAKVDVKFPLWPLDASTAQLWPPRAATPAATRAWRLAVPRNPGHFTSITRPAVASVQKCSSLARCASSKRTLYLIYSDASCLKRRMKTRGTVWAALQSFSWSTQLHRQLFWCRYKGSLHYEIT